MNALRVSCITIIAIALPCAFMRFLLLPSHKIIVCDWFLSPVVHTLLTKYQVPKKLFSSDYIDEILEEIPALRAIQTRIIRFKTLHVIAQGRRPWLKINNQAILTRDGVILPNYFFNNELIESLGYIHADPHSFDMYSVNTELYNFLKNIPQELLSDLRITWHNKTNISIELLQQPRITLIAHYNNKLTEKIMQFLATISQEKGTSKTKKMPLTVDIRFKNQLIVRYKKGDRS